MSCPQSARLFALIVLTAAAGSARADSYAAQTLVIPMDTTYQDSGMLKAYGLVYKLLSSGVPVHWAISQTKTDQNGVDITATTKNFKTGAAVGTASYRGGPFLVPSAYHSAAAPIVQAWQTANAAVTVHEATAPFTAPIAQRLVAAPNLSVFADGNEQIAFNYLNAAGIPDSSGNAWPTKKDNSGAYASNPDVLNEDEVSGPTTTNHEDGALLEGGQPKFCHMLSMHYSQANHLPEVVAETRSYLSKPGTQYVGECQSATAFNNDPQYGHFLTSGDIAPDSQPSSVTVVLPSSPYVQFHGAFGTVGGSEASWSETTRFAATDILLKGAGSAAGRQEVAFSGFLDGDVTKGHALWVGGHQYTVALPISSNPTTNGVRIFLNGLLASPCGGEGTQPQIDVSLEGPTFTATSQVTYTIRYSNSGQWPSQATQLLYTAPSGVTVVSTSPSAALSGSTATWTIGSIAPGGGGSVTVTVNLGTPGTTTAHQARAVYKVGVTPTTAWSNVLQTWYYAGPVTLTADWVYTEPFGRRTDGLAVAELDGASSGREILLTAPSGNGSNGRSIVLRSSNGTEASSFSPAAGRNMIGPALAATLGGAGYVTAESVSLVNNASVFARAGSSVQGVWTSLPYGWPSYWFMGPAAADVASSGGNEVLVADWNGNVKVLAAADATVLSSFNTWTAYGDHLYGHPAVADLDGDGTKELVLAGYTRGTVTVLNAEVPTTLTAQWTSAALKELYGDSLFASGPALGNIDGDSTLEIVVATAGTTGDIYAFDVSNPNGSTCEHRWNPPGTHSYTSPVIGDVDGSGARSIVVVSSTSSTVSILRPGAPGCSSAGGAILWQHQIKAGEGSEFVPSLYDFNGDGALDVVAASYTRLEVLDVKNRVVLLRFDDASARFSPSAVVANADLGSGVAELYVTGYLNGKVYRLGLPATANSAVEWPTFMGDDGRSGRR